MPEIPTALGMKVSRDSLRWVPASTRLPSDTLRFLRPMRPRSYIRSTGFTSGMPCRRPSGSWILPEDDFAVRAILPHPEGRGFSRISVSPAALASLRDQHRQLQRLLVVESRVHLRAIRSLQVTVGQAAGPTGTFGDVVARQLDMHAT